MDNIHDAFLKVQGMIEETYVSRIRTYGPDVAKALIDLFDTVREYFDPEGLDGDGDTAKLLSVGT